MRHHTSSTPMAGAERWRDGLDRAREDRSDRMLSPPLGRFLAWARGIVPDQPDCYRPWSPVLLAHRVRHRLTGPQRGCSCTRCFQHPRRRVPTREIYHDRVRLAELERRLRQLERTAGAHDAESSR